MSSRYLYRYMNLAAVIYMLQKRCVTLLSPDTWDDTNDSHFMSLYSQSKGLQTLVAACFSQAPETYHHWHVFANGASGVCVRFDQTQLLKAVDKVVGVRRKPVTYLALNQIEDRPIATRELPFLKRYAYEHEQEYRVIFESTTESYPTYDIAVPLAAIERVLLSPWMNRKLYLETKRLLKKISGCDAMKFLQSTLISNERWKEYGATAT